MRKPILCALGGPSCSGKTTLAKHLQHIMGDKCLILHQDDYAPPQASLPLHPKLQVEDWDAAPTAIEWQGFRSGLRYIRENAALPPGLVSHDHLNEQIPVPIPNELTERWKKTFDALDEEIVYIICDGFLLYWDEDACRQYDVKLFVREGFHVLKQRREARAGYVTASGDLWKDPEGYWDEVAWPAYLDAHKSIFIDGDVTNGEIDSSTVAGSKMVLLQGQVLSMSEIVDKSCRAILDAVKAQ